MRRLTRFEYNNTVKDLVGDTTAPGNALPSEQLGNGFGNDADAQSASTLLAQQYISVARDIARRATAPGAFELLLPCAANLGSTALEMECVGGFVQTIAPKAYRRPLAAGEAEELLALFQTVRTSGATLSSSVGAVVEAVLLAPEFLYRPEFGVPVSGRPDLMRPTGDEMATRLAYLYWGTLPDAELTAAAGRGELETSEGVQAQASRLLNDVRAQRVVSFFFDNLLPISGVAALERDRLLYPTFSERIGALFHEETQAFVRHLVFEGGGNLDTLFTAPFTFANEELATYYGFSGVVGPQFRQVPLDVTKRMGVLTQGSVVSGTVHSNKTNPVTRGAFVVRKLLCQTIPLPPAAISAQIKPPNPDQGPTARERFAAHSQNSACAGCHAMMDPVGLALENFDAVGLWRDTENGVVIDARGQMGVLGAPFNGPIELAQRVAATNEAKSCFAGHWMTFAYGRALTPADRCSVESVQNGFATSGFDVKALLTQLSQSDAFLYLSTAKE